MAKSFSDGMTKIGNKIDSFFLGMKFGFRGFKRGFKRGYKVISTRGKTPNNKSFKGTYSKNKSYYKRYYK